MCRSLGHRLNQKVYHGISDPKMGCLGGATNLAQLPESNHKLVAVGGILEKENHILLNAFLKRKERKRKIALPKIPILKSKLI